MNVALTMPDGQTFRASATNAAEVNAAAATVIRHLRETCTLLALAQTRRPPRRPLSLKTKDGSPSVAGDIEAHDALAYAFERVDWSSIKEWAQNNMISTSNRAPADVLREVNRLRRSYLLPPYAISA